MHCRVQLTISLNVSLCTVLFQLIYYFMRTKMFQKRLTFYISLGLKRFDIKCRWTYMYLELTNVRRVRYRYFYKEYTIMCKDCYFNQFFINIIIYKQNRWLYEGCSILNIYCFVADDTILLNCCIQEINTDFQLNTKKHKKILLKYTITEKTKLHKMQE